MAGRRSLRLCSARCARSTRRIPVARLRDAPGRRRQSACCRWHLSAIPSQDGMTEGVSRERRVRAPAAAESRWIMSTWRPHSSRPGRHGRAGFFRCGHKQVPGMSAGLRLSRDAGALRTAVTSGPTSGRRPRRDSRPLRLPMHREPAPRQRAPTAAWRSWRHRPSQRRRTARLRPSRRRDQVRSPSRRPE